MTTRARAGLCVHIWTDSVNIMTLRLIQKRTATAVRAAADTRGVDAATLAQATGLNHSEMNDRLSGRTPFTISELVRVGGLLCVPAGELLEGIA